MARGWAILIFVIVLLISAGGIAIVIWQMHVRGFSRYTVGGLMVVLGIFCCLMNWCVSDEYLRQHFGGEQNARRMREMWRGGWVGIVVGGMMIAAGYFLG